MSERATATVVAVRTTRQALRSAVIWGLLFGWLIANEALSYHSGFPDQGSRTRFAATMADNHGIVAVTGPARQLDTLGGFVAWRMVSLMLAAGAIWGLLLATRLLRGEEDAGRWDLLLAGRTSRRQAAAQALAGLGVAWLVLWTLTATGTVIAGLRPQVGFSVADSLFYATTGTASAAMFLAIGALTSQLAANRRQASAIAGLVFGAAWVLRMLADGGVVPADVRWLTPLGWVENLAPLTDPQPWALLPIVVIVAACSWAAVELAGRRDVAEGVWGRTTPRAARTRLLTGPAGLALRLERWAVISWVLGLGALALVFGLVARAAAQGSFGEEGLGGVVSSGAQQTNPTAAWIGYEFLYLAAILAFAAAAQVSAMRGEEAEGHLDHLFSRPVSRRTWVLGRLGLGAAMVLGAAAAIGLGGRLGVAGVGGVDSLDMVGTAFNTAVPGLLTLGLGVLLLGFAPRLAAPALYALILWSFLAEILGNDLLHAPWLTQTSVLHHLGPVPAAGIDWTAVAVILGLAVVAGAAGTVRFQRRDLVAS